ncbi:MAG: hypothetical protein NTW10_10830 [Bacteroidetes bacterium]|nr:hypothetical protein [Bacteroidota bacterium]
MNLYYNYTNTGLFWAVFFITGIVFLILLVAFLLFMDKYIFNKLLYRYFPGSEDFLSSKVMGGVGIIIFLFLWLFISYKVVSHVDYSYLGGREEFVLQKQYDARVKKIAGNLKSNFRENNVLSPSAGKAGGILVLSECNEEIKLESYLMFLLPDHLKPIPGSDPRLIILISVPSKHVATRIGAGGGEIYDFSYIFDIRDYKTGEVLKTVQSPTERRQSKLPDFPVRVYRQALQEAEALLTR